jgi:ribosomal protein L37AE/L43A
LLIYSFVKHINLKTGLKLKFGVYWDRNLNPFCSTCKTPLQTVNVESYGIVTWSCCKCNKPLKFSDGGKLVSMKYVSAEVEKLFKK